MSFADVVGFLDDPRENPPIEKLDTFHAAKFGAEELKWWSLHQQYDFKLFPRPLEVAILLSANACARNSDLDRFSVSSSLSVTLLDWAKLIVSKLFFSLELDMGFRSRHIVDFNIPVLFVLDRFDEIQPLFRSSNPSRYAEHAVDFLHIFAGPNTRASHLKNRT